jgi:hypothetical protein
MRRIYAIIVAVMLVFMSLASISVYTPSSALQATGTPAANWEDFDAANFTAPTTINNKWFPLTPGMQWVYEGNTEDNGKITPHRVVLTITDLTKVITDVRTIVAWEQDFSEGALVETELVFFAQARDGAVWQFGQHPEVYENGKMTENPAWFHGVEDARAGIVMEANPQVGSRSYSQGWAPAVDYSDRGETHLMGQETCVPTNCYKDVLVIKEYALNEPNAFQYKYYAPGVGGILVDWGGSDQLKERLELVSVGPLSAEARAAANGQALGLEQHAYQVSPNVYGKTAPSDAPPGTVVPTAATMEATAGSASASNGPQTGHWEGSVEFEGGAVIAFDLMPNGEIDNIEVQLTVNGTACVAEVELATLTPDRTFTLAAAPDTNGIQGKFESASTASGTVTLHDCSGTQIPPLNGVDSYTWTAKWVSDQVG